MEPLIIRPALVDAREKQEKDAAVQRKKEKREQLAAQIVVALAPNRREYESYMNMAAEAVALADALIAKLEVVP